MKPARVQVTQAQLDEYLKEKRPEGGTYNIWHHRYSGLERDFNKTSVRPKFKVDIARDAGETLGSRNKNAYFCLFFAKGMCSKGPKCTMWHRVPTTDDVLETTIDCFGRDKFTEFRQDMGGVGGFIRENRTLYIGRITVTDDIEDVVRRQFGQFGPLERVRILRGRGVGFVTYKTRANAEFAREAMMNQSLENNEIVNVRWATADPNAIANRLDAEDDRVEAERIAALRAEHNLDDETENQEEESELPAEFTSLKRDVDEDGFSQMEQKVKRQRAEIEAAQAQEEAASAAPVYEYTQEDYDNYYKQQEEYYKQQQELEAQQNVKVGGIIPQNVLSNLKSFSKATPAATSANTTTATASKPTTGLGSLTNYGTDSEDDE
ncbi:Pre-mRNA-splicing factor [Mucor circinelloides]